MSYSTYDNSHNHGTSEADFQKLAQTIATSIQKILQNVSSMQRMVNQFGTAQDSPELKQQLHQIRTYTQQLIKDTDNLLKDLVNCKDRHLKIQRDRLVDEFTAALTAFQAVQRKTVEFEKNLVKQARANNYNISKPPGSGGGNNSGLSSSNNSSNNYHSGGNNSNKNSNNAMNSSGGGAGSNGSGSLFEDNFINSKNATQLQMQDDIDLQALEEQERTIRELEENIVGVNDIYKKLGAMVYEQGTIVDSIEASVEQTSVFVSDGTEQLKKASTYQNKLRRKKFFIALILLIILIVIISLIIFNN